MDNNPFHADELLTTLISVQVILTHHHTVLISLQAVREQQKHTTLTSCLPIDSRCYMFEWLSKRWLFLPVTAKPQPEDTVSRRHDVETVNDTASTQVVVWTVTVRVILERHLEENSAQTHISKEEDFTWAQRSFSMIRKPTCFPVGQKHLTCRESLF